MSGSAGRRDKTHIWWRNYFRTNNVPCWECGGTPYAADHYPALSTGQWDGEYRSHCRYHSAKQGADITNKRHNNPSRVW